MTFGWLRQWGGAAVAAGVREGHRHAAGGGGGEQEASEVGTRRKRLRGEAKRRGAGRREDETTLAREAVNPARADPCDGGLSPAHLRGIHGQAAIRLVPQTSNKSCACTERDLVVLKYNLLPCSPPLTGSDHSERRRRERHRPLL